MDKERDPRIEKEDLDETSEERITGASDEEEFEDIDDSEDEDTDEETEDE